jgi:hypothetical protein
MLPQQDKGQLSQYYNEQMYRYNEFMYAPMTGTGRPFELRGIASSNYYGYPINTVVANNYAGMSTAPNKTTSPTPTDPATKTNKIPGAYDSV